ncbi:MAG TPA: hypothetical protein VFI76_03930 [Terrimicrobiaceae bacterium]|nr:hypothetical protein [Terrimicrobiaceae bacterium]
MRAKVCNSRAPERQAVVQMGTRALDLAGARLYDTQGTDMSMLEWQLLAARPGRPNTGGRSPLSVVNRTIVRARQLLSLTLSRLVGASFQD